MKISIALAFLFISASVFAQGQQGKGHGQKKDMQKKSEKIKAMKVEFITTKLDLTSAEAQEFWPVYNEFADKRHKLEMNRRGKMKENKDKELSDNEVNEMIEFMFDTDQKLLDLSRKYDSEFKKVLSIQKVGLLYKAEHDFKKEILRKMKSQGGPPSAK